MEQPNNSACYSKFVDAWHKAIYPARPSLQEIDIFDELMRDFKHKKLLILGSTPEFRDLGAKNNLQVTCADANSDMLEGMKQLMYYKNTHEQLVACNWLALPFQDSSFALVYGEQSINVLPLEQWEHFLQNVFRVLEPNGRFVLKIMMRKPGDEKSILSTFKKRNYDLAYIKLKAFGSLLPLTNNSLCIGDSVTYVTDLFKRSIVSSECYQRFLYHVDDIGKSGLRAYMMDKELFELLLSNYFHIEKKVHGADFEFHEHHPIYVLKKK
ncbi:class I SAM-dependent methyltransferase [Candidatus Woesearchaeota archaeon]|nr:class I SAM-dependent methyltransferase [Candidatus Woesearchaeota archaeon]